jgi:rare lipoprotein A
MKQTISRVLLIGFLVLGLYACHNKSIPSGSSYKYSDTGNASYYSDKLDGNKTANGEIFRQNKLTAAHKTLPFGTEVKVTNLANHKSVIVRINDRGPFVSGRIIDLSKAAAKQIDMVNAGVIKVRIEYNK